MQNLNNEKCTLQAPELELQEPSQGVVGVLKNWRQAFEDIAEHLWLDSGCEEIEGEAPECLVGGD